MAAKKKGKDGWGGREKAGADGGRWRRSPVARRAAAGAPQPAPRKLRVLRAESGLLFKPQAYQGDRGAGNARRFACDHPTT